MGLETGTRIEDLVASNPLGTDPKAQGDDHLRLLKACVQGSLPALGPNAVTASAIELNRLTGAKDVLIQSVRVNEPNYLTDAGPNSYILNDVAPLITQGMQAVAGSITPTVIGSKIRVTAQALYTDGSTNTRLAAAIHKDAIVDAVASGLGAGKDNTGQAFTTVLLTHEENSVSLDPINFQLRVGSFTGAAVFVNGTQGRIFGGTVAQTFILLEEFAQ